MDIHSFSGDRSPGIVAPFRYDVADDRWEWSDHLYELHGYTPREIPATTSALMHHKHPDDRDRAAGVFAAVIRDGGTYSCYHRIVDRNRKVLSVVSVGKALLEPHGRAVEIQGYYIDLTQVRRDETQADVEQALIKKAMTAPVIEQAKGMIMLVEGCTADEAFERLRVCSQLANRKVADIAQTLVASADQSAVNGDMVSETLERLVRASRAGGDASTRQRTSV
ncbi:PAS and ANTAR domain-containing protein [Nocardioides hwasunensis]|uniref:PAS and ANTAR domain-containing protein n=1 Tax=Nocardioides hwasunensis TaxID=397258 RepID=A0ABR8MLN5_9ACTN|nr:PAS and ANTAR domain-containing protein [Nocardioides hwasunensis]MBD3915434.1 PAS and ANTAR domain-containing protein [Nocardioides hwasunensis]